MQVRTRKRLSIRSDNSSTEGRRSSVTSGASSTNGELVATPSEVNTIYETCAQMFNANVRNYYMIFASYVRE